MFTMVEIASKLIMTDVTSIKCFQKYILAGIGGNLHIYDLTGKQLQIYNVFQGQKIHGIVPNTTNKIALFGANMIKIVEFDCITSQITKELSSRHCEDWILALQWTDEDTQIATIFANNFVTLWAAENIVLVHNVACKERCILYSAHLVNHTWNELYVLSGTVFSEVLIWRPSDNVHMAPVLWRLKGHDGVIFSVTYNKPLNIIVTTSDDRTVRIWSVRKNMFSENSDKKFKSSPIRLKHTMYGHTARVFRCRILKNCILTTGEDSLVKVWDLNGNLTRQIETHQGGCVWSLDYTEDENYVVTGGGDCGVSMHPLEIRNHYEFLPKIKHDDPVSLKITAASNVVAMYKSGALKYYNRNKKISCDVCQHDDLKSYAILEISECRELIGLAGFHGTIHIYKEENNALKKLYSLHPDTRDKKRILSLHWLNKKQILTSTVDTEMRLWDLKNSDDNVKEYKLECFKDFLLSPCKECIPTCAVLCFENKIAVGDKKGNIHLFSLDKQYAIQTVKKVHNHLGVTSLHFLENKLFSLGRTGILKKYSRSERDSDKVVQTSSNKVPFSWLCSLVEKNSNIMLIGFYGAHFVLWDHKNRKILHEIKCGGGHRSWDFFITSNSVNFVYTKDKIIHDYTCELSNILTKNLITGYHTKEINSTVMVKLNSNKILFISGGEDTTVRLSIANIKNNFETFHTFDNVKVHLSSVRCITVCKLRNGCYLMFSGGSREQIILWKVEYHYSKTKPITCSQMDNYHETLEKNECDIRVMDLATIKLKNVVLLIAACSDGTLKCYLVNLLRYQLVFAKTVKYLLKCILKVAHLSVSGQEIVISMGTDGNLSFWDFTKFCEAINQHLIPDFSVIPKPIRFIDLQPFFSLPAHQSGINSFHHKFINDNICILATGGDDNAIVLNVVKFEFTDSLELKVYHLTKWVNPKIHGAQITGIYIYKNLFITASIDQYVSVFIYEFKENVLKCTLVKQYCSVIADIQGMNCLLIEKEMYTCLYGKGIEVCKMNCLGDNT